MNARINQPDVGNKILASLPENVFTEIAPLLERVEVESGKIFHHQEEPIRHVHFPEGGLLSLLSALEDGTVIEVAMVGREGIGGVSVLLGADDSLHTVQMHVGGTVLRMRAEDARRVFNTSEPFRRSVLAYTRLLLMLASQKAACNTLHTVEERLARWLMMAQWRLGTNHLPLTQEFLSQMLGVRRSGVTVACGLLQNAGLIETRRGIITVVDSERLLGAACECTTTMIRGMSNFPDDAN